MIGGKAIAGFLSNGLHSTVPAIWCNLAVVVVFAISYAGWCFKEWEKHMAAKRVTRGMKSSPSNPQLPDMESSAEALERILENSKHHEDFDSYESLKQVRHMKTKKTRSTVSQQRALRTPSLVPEKLQSLVDAATTSLNMEEKARELDMDHVYVGFFNFLWAYTFIGPCSYFLWRKGTMILRLRDFLARRGIIKPPPCDYEAMCATLLLEQTQAIHHCSTTKHDGANVAGFFFANFPYVDNSCAYQVADLFAVDIDLDNKRFIKANLDGVVLTAKETVILLWFNTIAAQHVKLHAVANWGLNLDESLQEVNPFFRRNSVVTVMYNFFGHTCFNGYMKAWADEGLVSDGWASEEKPFAMCVNHGVKNNAPQHAQIRELVKHSEFVHFIVNVRAIFLAEFSKHKHLFPGTDGEAMFVGTVLHSLDHTFMDWNMTDPLWLDVDDPRFGKMAEVGRVVKAGFVQDVPGLYFHKRFKGSGHPFYEAVYRKAAKINKKLADEMDTCIVK